METVPLDLGDPGRMRYDQFHLIRGGKLVADLGVQRGTGVEIWCAAWGEKGLTVTDGDLFDVAEGFDGRILCRCLRLTQVPMGSRGRRCQDEDRARFRGITCSAGNLP